MKDDSGVVKMKDGWRDKNILDIIKNNPGINQETIIKQSGMNKAPVFTSLGRLIEKKLVEFARLSQNEKSFFVRLSENVPNFDENIQRMKDDFEIMNTVVYKSLELVQKGTSSEMVSVCIKCIEAIFSFKAGLEFSIASNKVRKYPRIWDELKNEADELLKKVAQSIKGKNLHAKIVEHLGEKNLDSLQELNWFLKSSKKTN